MKEACGLFGVFITKINSNINTWKTEFVNDLEHITFSLYPELQEIKEYLYSICQMEINEI